MLCAEPPGRRQDTTEEVAVLIDCDQCIRQHTGACRDCVVTHLLSDLAGPVRVDEGQAEALEVLAECGLVPQLKLAPVGRDCLKLAEARLLTEGWADESSLAAWRAETVNTVEEAVARVQREPGPDPYKEDWCPLASRHLSETHES